MFRSIAGHRRLLALLSRAVARNRLPPSLLFAGPAGVGKRRTAFALAQALNCLTPVTSTGDDADGPSGEAPALEYDACGVCTACRRIARQVHPDVLLLEPGENGAILIGPVRDAVSRAGYRPFEARRRVVIIDQADALRDEAQNALLKTLEEPPAASVFILVSSVPDGLLPTVRSRCPRLRFGALSPADIAAALVRDHGYTTADAHVAAAEAGGSIGAALDAASSDRLEAREAARRLLEHTARQRDPSRRIEALKDFAAGRGSTADERARLARYLRSTAALLRDLSLIAAGADDRLLANADIRDELDALARAYDGQRLDAAYSAVDEALGALERNVSPKMVGDWIAVRL